MSKTAKGRRLNLVKRWTRLEQELNNPVTVEKNNVHFNNSELKKL